MSPLWSVRLARETVSLSDRQANFIHSNTNEVSPHVCIWNISIKQARMVVCKIAFHQFKAALENTWQIHHTCEQNIRHQGSLDLGRSYLSLKGDPQLQPKDLSDQQSLVGTVDTIANNKKMSNFTA